MKCQCGCGEDAPIADRTDRSRGRVKGEPLRFVHGHNRRRYHEPPREIRCYVCGITKAAEEFYPDAKRPTGRGSSCKECRKAAVKARHAAHPEQTREQGRRWRTANPERSREHTKCWRQNHPQEHAERQRRRTVRLRSGVIEKIDPFAIYDRDGGRCHICGGHVKKGEMSLDHLIPVSKGGDHVVLNVRLAHRLCNSKRGAGRLPAQLLLL